MSVSLGKKGTEEWESLAEDGQGDTLCMLKVGLQQYEISIER